MSTNHPLFDKVFSGVADPAGPPLTGEDLKTSGMESVLKHAPEEYQAKFLDAVRSFAVGAEITVEDVRERAGNPPESVHYNVMGPLMRRAACRKLIVCTNQMRNAKRPSLHASKLMIWRRV